MSRTTSNSTQHVQQQCRRLKAGWSKVERRRRHEVACRRQEVLWQLLCNRSASGHAQESEILAIGAPTIADLARFAG